MYTLFLLLLFESISKPAKPADESDPPLIGIGCYLTISSFSFAQTGNRPKLRNVFFFFFFSRPDQPECDHLEQAMDAREGRRSRCRSEEDSIFGVPYSVMKPTWQTSDHSDQIPAFDNSIFPCQGSQNQICLPVTPGGSSTRPLPTVT